MGIQAHHSVFALHPWLLCPMALPMKAMKAMKASKAMKSKAMAAMRSGSSGAMTATGAYKSVGESTGLKVKQVKECIEAYMGVAASQLKAAGSFKFAGSINMKLKKKPAMPARKGVNPFTKEPCVFKAKPASKTVRAFPMKKLKELIN